MNSEPKTPWNPSRTATARVIKTGPLPAPIECPICGSNVEIVSNDVIYGRKYGEWPWAYRCSEVACDSYVGMHPFTAIPLGTLANKATRAARKKAKAVFAVMWESKRMTRKEAYAWLAKRLEIENVNHCHIGWFDAVMCERVFDICMSERRAD